jgi:hypothetical protein
MKRASHLILTTFSAAALAMAACSSSNSSSSGKGGAGGSSNGDSGATADAAPAFVGIALTPNSTGYVKDTSGSGIVGAWYVYGDSLGSKATRTDADFADSDCAKAGFTADQCSQITTPVLGMPFSPDPTTGAMCTSGTAAKAIPKAGTTNPDYSDLFGAGIGLDFDNPGGDAGAKQSIDLSSYAGIGFDFSGDLVPANYMRVNFPFDGENNGTDSPFWEGATKAASPLTSSTHAVIHWSDVGGPSYLLQQSPPTTPPAFQPSKLLSIQFQVFTNMSSTTPYSFCVNNLTLLTQ